MQCPKCRHENPFDASYCALCYEPLKKEQPQDSPSAAAGFSVPPTPAVQAANLTKPVLKIFLAFAGILLTGFGAYIAFILPAIGYKVNGGNTVGTTIAMVFYLFFGLSLIFLGIWLLVYIFKKLS